MGAGERERGEREQIAARGRVPDEVHEELAAEDEGAAGEQDPERDEALHSPWPEEAARGRSVSAEGSTAAVECEGRIQVVRRRRGHGRVVWRHAQDRVVRVGGGGRGGACGSR